MGVSDSTIASKKEDTSAKVEDYFGGSNGLEVFDH
jgi:hypothetical protein